MFLPREIFYEKEVENYPLGKELLDRYRKKQVPCTIIQNHNAIEEMRKKQNIEFPRMKQNLIIGIRKTHRFVPNHKVSDFLVPYTSSGCIAMCLYCYLVCNYNKCAYLRLFVNREQMLDKILRVENEAERPLTFEIGSNSDLILENTITGNLEWTIENFAQKAQKGFLTFPTKFDRVQPLLSLQHKGKTIVRMSVNPQEIISQIEIGTSPLKNRVKAINQLKEAGYPVGILIAPVILIENWKKLYEELIQYLSENLSKKVRQEAVFEIIFMTYSYIHEAINTEAFPNKPSLYDKEKMAVRGRGKYRYKEENKQEAEIFLRELMHKYFPDNTILYIV